LLRIHFDFFDYASILFLHLEVFTEHGMRPGRHDHRERATGCSGGAAHAVGDGQHKAGRRARATVAMAGRHRAQAVATTTRPALALSWAWDDLNRWATSWAARKQREGEWNGGAGRIGLGVQPGFGPLPNRS
jgi:hypothetical protein